MHESESRSSSLTLRAWIAGLLKLGVPAGIAQLVHKPPISMTIAPWDQWSDERGVVQVGHHLVTDRSRGTVARRGKCTTSIRWG